LGERNRERGFTIGALSRQHAHERLSGVKAYQLGGEFPTLAVEQRDRVAWVHAQDPEVVRRALRQPNFGAEGNVNRGKQARRGAGRWGFHATISSISDAFLFA
jgi:hypothetical protein